jgi:predicted O-methyltransferase YrrM
MDQELFSAVDQYLQELLIKPDPEFEKINQRSLDAGLPSIQITAAQGRLLEMLVRFGRVKRILEIGTLGGYSTAWLAKGLNAGGKLISLEINPEHAAVAEQNLSLFQFDADVEIRVGDGRDLLQELIETKSDLFELIFIDAAKDQYSEYLELALRLAKPGTMIIADNVVRRGKVIDEKSDDPSVRGIQAFNQKIANTPNLSTTVIQTVGLKGYDGFTFIQVQVS